MTISTEALTVVLGFAGLSVTALGGVMIALINKGNKQLRPNGGGSMFDIIMQMNTRLTRVEDSVTSLTAGGVRIETKVDTAANTAASTAATTAVAVAAALVAGTTTVSDDEDPPSQVRSIHNPSQVVHQGRSSKDSALRPTHG